MKLYDMAPIEVRYGMLKLVQNVVCKTQLLSTVAPVVVGVMSILRQEMCSVEGLFGHEIFSEDS